MSSLEHLVIVDSKPDDYTSLLASHEAPKAVFHFCTTATAAQKFFAESHALWIVNLDLPDMPGLILATEFMHCFPDRRIVLVADRYCEATERMVRMHSGLPFVCKPARIDWLSFADGHAVLDQDTQLHAVH
jgi:DNA-binding response OmpR family regulator